MFPLVVDLRGRRVVVVGAGTVGAHKSSQLLAAGANVTVISDVVVGKLPDGVESVLERRYQPGDLDGAFLAVAATGDRDVNDLIVEEARQRNILLNVVDDLARSNFFFTAVHRDGDVLVSVSTEGSSPALAQWIRNAVAAALPKNLGAVASRLRAERAGLHAAGQTSENRPWAARVEALIDELGVRGPGDVGC
jgi:siroheme synthase-like protein